MSFLLGKLILKDRAVTDTGTELSGLKVLELDISHTQVTQYQLDHWAVNLHIQLSISCSVARA